MITCIAGVSCTGKTSLVNNLRIHHDLLKVLNGDDVIFVTEYVREFVEQHYPNMTMNEILADPERAITLQFDLADATYKMYLEMLANPQKLYICDRSPLDVMVYTILNYYTDNELMTKHASRFAQSCALLSSMVNYVDRIYLTQVDQTNNEVQVDGFRPERFTHRRQLEIELFNSIFDFNPKVVKLPSLSTLRVNTVMKDLTDKLRPTGRF